ncbi:hypothetical protein BDV98DRAFT_595039 [Pterulicium gracile]|uniref:DUF6535 domain-containing protein n=1 Tax=Pterulicium gracile TaxID=1884261 RepID=A0A5C3QC85_9AGAR|nr:hypothetical protein BDV98DRAFT_595039 [Pterula gracilis]
MKQVLNRHFRYMGLNRWRVPLIIGLLPSLLHVSLFLFLTGTALFLFPLDQTASVLVITVTCVTCATCIISSLVPVVLPQCPYRTPISSLAARGTTSRLVLTFQTLRPLSSGMKTLHDRITDSWVRKAREDTAVEGSQDALKSEATMWLHGVSSNPVVSSIVYQAVAGLPTTFHPRLNNLKQHMTPYIIQQQGVASLNSADLFKLD